MKNKFSDPRKDIYLYGRFCDYFHTSKELTEAQKKKDAHKRMKAYYGVPTTILKPLIEKRRIAVHGASYPLP